MVSDARLGRKEDRRAIEQRAGHLRGVWLDRGRDPRQVHGKHVGVKPAEDLFLHYCDHEARVQDPRRRADAEALLEPRVRQRVDPGGLHAAQVDRHPVGMPKLHRCLHALS